MAPQRGRHRPAEPGLPRRWPHFAFHFQERGEVDRIREQLVQQGHSCGPVHDHRDGTASFYMQDPEGNWLEMLYEPAEGLPSNVGVEPIAVGRA